MESFEAIDAMSTHTHTVWTVDHGKEVGRALGLPDDVLPIRDFSEQNAFRTSNPKGYFPAEPNQRDQTGIAVMDLALVTIRYYELHDAGANDYGRGSACRARAEVIRGFLHPMSGDDCPKCGAKRSMELTDESTDTEFTFYCHECGWEVSNR